MKRAIRLAAGDDIAAALEFYSSDNPHVASDFVAEIDRVLDLIERHPEVGRETSVGCRSFPLSRFPYLLHYRVDDDAGVIEVVAVTHSSRRPDFWRSRVEEPVLQYETVPRVAWGHSAFSLKKQNVPVRNRQCQC